MVEFRQISVSMHISEKNLQLYLKKSIFITGFGYDDLMSPLAF